MHHCVALQDPAQAEAALGSSLIRSPFPLSSPPDVSSPGPDISVSDSSPTRGFPSAETNMALSTVQRAQTPTVGTPMKLAPSTSAFRKPGSGAMPGAHPVADAQQRVVGGLHLPGSAGASMQPSVSKGFLGQMSDMILGW